MRRQLKKERITEKVALMLLTLTQDKNEPERTYEMVANEAANMAYRAHRAKTDPTWWEIAGRPYWNERMARIRAKVKT